MKLEGTRRVVIENVRPAVDCGRFPIKRVVGETVGVEADLFTDGHDAVTGVLLHRHDGEAAWSETPLLARGDDHFGASFPVTRLGRYRYAVEGWIDGFGGFRRDLAKRVEVGQDVRVDLALGAALVEAAAAGASDEASALRRHARGLADAGTELDERVRRALEPELRALMSRHPDRRRSTRSETEWAVVVEPVLARTGAWYEMFPRSATGEPGRHGTLRDAEARLAYVASMGFDVLYLPPIHPIGRTQRKGANNALVAAPDDPGSPWAIGAAEGGHTAVHPALGTLADFDRFVARAREQRLEVALDIAFQCSPDHPWVREHPEWFRRRPNGTIAHAENPPKKYQDIYPFDFESPAWRELWQALRDVFLFWIGHGVRAFRVDNPHTKSFAFWEWVLDEVKREHPETIFLSEAFTRPKVMYRLAKLGFSQSYTYFTWRNTKAELTDYLTQLTATEVREFFRPSLWPNTPDILNEYLQAGGRPAFAARAILAATLGASWGIYGPAYELALSRPREPGSEEYLGSEKYELRAWNLDDPASLREVIAAVNRIRRDNPALQANRNLAFHSIDNEKLLAYSKHTDDLTNLIVVVVNLDPHHKHSGWLELPLERLGLDAAQPYQAHDLLGLSHYVWNGPRNYVEIDPQILPAQVFRIRRRLKTERDFDYYL